MAARSKGYHSSTAASRVRQASREHSGLLGVMRPSHSPNSPRTPQTLARWVKRRRLNRHRAIVVATRGALPGFCPSNADSFLQPFGPPVLQVTSEEASFLADCARKVRKRSDSARRTRAGAGIQCRRVSLRVEQRRRTPGRHDAAKRMVELRERARWGSGLLARDHARRARCGAGQGCPVCCFKRP